MKQTNITASDFLFTVGFILCMMELVVPSSFASTIKNRAIIGAIPAGGFFPSFNLSGFLGVLNDPVALLLPIVVLTGFVLRGLSGRVKVSKIQRFLKRMGVPYF